VNRKDCLEAYQDFSAQTSDNVRKLSFAGIGAIWVFRGQPETVSLGLPTMLVWSGFAIVLALLLDFLQYGYATVAWGALHRAKEKANLSLTEEFKAPAAINWPTITLFWFKVGCVAVGYAILLIFLIRRMVA
jgi:hypothetical protein